MTDFAGVVLDLATIDQGDLDLGRFRGTCDHWDLHPHTLPGQVPERIRGARVAVTNKVVLDRPLLQAAQGLELICVAATGTNNLDLDAARELGIEVRNVTGYATPSVVQHVFALILGLSTRLLDYRRAVAGGAWQRAEQFCLLDFPIREIAGRTLGIVGYGELGRAVAAAARAFGMHVVVANRPGAPPGPGRIDLDDLLPRVDVLTLHCPLADNTRGLIGERELARMRPDSLLINTARGGIVDDGALARALRARTIGGAGVDVLAAEPPRDGNPLLAGDIPNLILTPHVAWASRESRQRLADEVAANIEAFRRGESRNRVV